MSQSNENPMIKFSRELVDFARGERRGIRNPFVMVPVQPRIENRVTRRLEQWTNTPDGRLADWESATDADGTQVTATSIRLDELFPQTTAFQTSAELGPLDHVSTDSVEGTLKRNLGSELIDQLIEEYIRSGQVYNDRTSILVLLNLGSLYPFTRASELLDELDRKSVNTTVGIPFPGSVIGGRLSFFDENARHYYPAHRVGEKATEGYMTDV